MKNNSLVELLTLPKLTQQKLQITENELWQTSKLT